MLSTNWIEPEKITASYAWRRLFARGFDITFYWYLIEIILKLITYFLPGNSFVQIIKDKIDNTILIPFLISTYILIFINAILMHYFGNTLGKKILGIKVIEQNNTRPSFIRFAKRELLVIFKGEGLGIPLVSFICMFLSYKKLLKFKATSWDKQMNFKIVYRQQSIYITLIIVIIYAIFFELLKYFR